MSSEFEPKGEKWKHTLGVHFFFKSRHLRGITYCNRQILIMGGAIQIRPGYSWDGLDAKERLPRFLGLGINMNFWPGGEDKANHILTAYDAICQYRHELPISKEAASEILGDLLLKAGALPIFVSFYKWVVQSYGVQIWDGYLSRDLRRYQH